MSGLSAASTGFSATLPLYTEEFLKQDRTSRLIMDPEDHWAILKPPRVTGTLMVVKDSPALFYLRTTTGDTYQILLYGKEHPYHLGASGRDTDAKGLDLERITNLKDSLIKYVSQDPADPAQSHLENFAALMRVAFSSNSEA